MSTDAVRGGERRGTRRSARRRRAFTAGFAAVIAALVVVVGVGAALSLAQGPRVTDVQVDPDAAISTAGSRMIVTTNQSLAAISPDQVTVEPAADVSVDTSGRTLGIRFALPLQPDTEYTVTIEGVAGIGTGPSSTITESFRTAVEDLFLLQRGDERDTVFRTGISGEDAVAVFEASHIEDFRATAGYLVFSLRTDDDEPRLVVTDHDGQNAQDLTVPGGGTVTQLQNADRRDIVGYLYTDSDLTEQSGRVSALYTASLRDPDAEPVAVDIEGADARIAQWRFVPDTDSALVLTFGGRLLLTTADGSDAVDLGDAIAIDGIARGSSTAIVERADGKYAVDLTDGTSQPLPDADGFADAIPIGVTPLPGQAGSLRSYPVLDADGRAAGVTVQRVDADGSASELYTVDAGDALLQICVSPSGASAAVLVAPDIVANAYDTYLLPIPGDVETHVIDIESGEQTVALAGFGLSWCRVPVG